MKDLVKEAIKRNFELFIELVDNDEFKKQLVKELNEDIDIPIINEKTERKLLNSIYAVVIKSMKKADIDKMLENMEKN